MYNYKKIEKNIVTLFAEYLFERKMKHKGDKMKYLNAFWVGGLICVIGQILIDKSKLTPARILTSYVVVGVVLGALGLYEPLINYAGAGAAVPLSGFGYTISEGVKKAVNTDGWLGVFTGAVTSAAAGITAALVFALVAALFARSKDKA